MFDLEKAISERIKRRDLQIPPYPAVATRLSALVNKGDFGLKDLTNVLETDPALAASVLRYANAAAFSTGAGQITSVSRAAGRLGSKRIVNLALVQGLASQGADGGPLTELRGMVWRQSLTSALICQQLASYRRVNIDEAFACGLLHDLGELITILCIEAILAEDKEGKASKALPQSEWMEVIDRYHVEVGLEVAGRWNLSELVQEVIATHHKPHASSEHRAMVELVAASDQVVALMEQKSYVGVDDLARVPQLSDPAQRTLLGDLLPQVPTFIESFQDDGSGGAKPKKKAAKAAVVESKVEKPVTTLKGTVVAVDFKVIDPRPGGAVQYQACQATPDGAVIVGPASMAENSLVQLKLECEPKALDIWAKVALCVREEDAYRIEIQPFALDASQQSQWEALQAK